MLHVPTDDGTSHFRAAFSVVLPADVLRDLGPSADHAINGAETWWILKALEVWPDILQNRALIRFGDNRAAICGCISGYSRSPYVARLVGAVHERLCQFEVPCWFEYVHTKSNPLDGASRSDWRACLQNLGDSIINVEPTLQTDLSVFHPDSRSRALSVERFQ